MTEAFKFGPPEADALHVCVDMQRLFGEPTEWHCASLETILDPVAAIVAHAPARTVFTRFRTPETLDDAPGQWRHYYRLWESVLAGNLDPAMFDLVPRLAGFVPPASAIDKMTYSAFGAPEFVARLESLRPRTLIFTGVETDVCVLASVLDAVDHGYRAVLVQDALASGEEAGHASILDVARRRYGEQIELTDTETLLEEWRP